MKKSELISIITIMLIVILIIVAITYDRITERRKSEILSETGTEVFQIPRQGAEVWKFEYDGTTYLVTSQGGIIKHGPTKGEQE